MSKTPLRLAREKRGQTIQEVAMAVGIDAGNLSRIERDEQKPSTELAEKLAKHYGHEVTEMQILYPGRYMPSTEAAA